jgi:hypothetical protein
MFIFLGCHKNSLTERCSSFEDLLAHKTLWFHTAWCKFFIYLISLSICDFEMTECKGFKEYGTEVNFSGMITLLNVIKSTD